MKRIYILLTKTDTMLSRCIAAAEGKGFTHVALSLDDSFTKLYSFGRKFKHSYLPAGFVRESVHCGVLGDSEESPCAVYALEITDREFRKLCRMLNSMEKNRFWYRYNISGLVLCFFGVANERRHHFFCSQFVSYILTRAGVAEFSKAPSLVTPADFQRLPGAKPIFRGSIGQLRQVF